MISVITEADKHASTFKLERYATVDISSNYRKYTNQTHINLLLHNTNLNFLNMIHT